MNRTFRIIGIFTVFLFIVIGLLFFTAPRLDSAEAATIRADLTKTEFKVDNSGGLTPGFFEPNLKINNDDEENEKKIEISTTIPNGRDTGQTKDIYPHIFSDKKRKRDQGTTYSVTVESGETTFYPLIEVNYTTFADVYTFKIKVDNKSDKEETSIEVTVTVTEYNNIRIEFQETEDKEKKVTAGKETIVSVQLQNIGNIFEEEVDLEIEDLPDNLTLVEIQFPPLGTGERTTISPESFQEGRYFDIFIGVKLGALEDSGEGRFDIKIFVVTPGIDPPSGGHKFVKCTIIITEKSDFITPTPPPDEDEPFPVAIFGGGLAAIFIVMGGAFYFLVLNKEEEEEGGWAEGGAEGWGADEWGEDEAFDMGGAAEEYEAPITTSRASPQPRAGPKPVPRVAPVPRSATPRPAGPAHVKCPKCHTGIKVSNPKRPLTIGCPKCSTKFTLKGKPGVAPPAPAPRPRPAAPKPAGPAHVKCPNCHTGIKISNPKRPLTIGCPKCSTKFTLKGKPGAAPSGPSPRPKRGAPKARGPALISCPKCSTKFKVTNPKRPLKVACPRCKTGLNLK